MHPDRAARIRCLRVTSTGAAMSLLAVVFAPQAVAQIGAIGGEGAPSVSAPPVGTGRTDIFVRPGRVENALIVGDWLAYPSVFAGGVYDTNPNQRATGARSSFGARLTPSLLAETNNGISKTSLYGMADGRLYFERAAGSADALSVRSGVTEIYQPLPDLLFTGQGDYTRQKDIFSTLGVTNNLWLLNSTGVGLSPTTNPQSYNQFSGTATVQKNFATAFTILGGSVVDQVYDRSTATVGASPSGVTYTGTGRGGLWLTPALYGYIEGSLDTRDYSTIALNSSGYRLAGGLGTDQIGLLKGEVYGGFQSEKFKSGGLGTTNGAVFGGRVYYYPLPEMTVNLALDEAIGASLLVATATLPIGTSTKLTTLLGNASYAISPAWSASGRAGYIHTDYTHNPRRDDAWTVGSTFSYYFWQNIALTFDFQHAELRSNIAFQSFSRDVVSLGVTYKY